MGNWRAGVGGQVDARVGGHSSSSGELARLVRGHSSGRQVKVFLEDVCWPVHSVFGGAVHVLGDSQYKGPLTNRARSGRLSMHSSVKAFVC